VEVGFAAVAPRVEVVGFGLAPPPPHWSHETGIRPPGVPRH
jgi:hypothetical protein